MMALQTSRHYFLQSVHLLLSCMSTQSAISSPTPKRWWDSTAIFHVMSSVCIFQPKHLNLQVSAIHSSLGEAGQQAGKQVLAAYCVSMGAPYGWPDCEVRKPLSLPLTQHQYDRAWQTP